MDKRFFCLSLLLVSMLIIKKVCSMDSPGARKHQHHKHEGTKEQSKEPKEYTVTDAIKRIKKEKAKTKVLNQTIDALHQTVHGVPNTNDKGLIDHLNNITNATIDHRNNIAALHSSLGYGAGFMALQQIPSLAQKSSSTLLSPVGNMVGGLLPKNMGETGAIAALTYGILYTEYYGNIKAIQKLKKEHPVVYGLGTTVAAGALAAGIVKGGCWAGSKVFNR